MLSTAFPLNSLIPKPTYGQLSSLTDDELVTELQASVSRLDKISGVLDEAAVVDLLNHRITQLRNEVEQLVSDGEVKPNLRNHLDAIFPTLDNAHNFVLNSDEASATEMINTVNNKIMAFINMVEAEKGMRISVETADHLIAEATEISEISQKRGRDLASLIDGAQLPITSEVISISSAEYSLMKNIIAELQSRGIQIDFEVEQNSPGILRLIVLGVKIGVTLTNAYLATIETSRELEARGLPPLDSDEFVQLYLINLGVFGALNFVVGPGIERNVLNSMGFFYTNQIPVIELFSTLYSAAYIDPVFRALVLVPAEVELMITLRAKLIEAHLRVIKDVINDDGGALVASDFMIHVTGTNASPADFVGVPFPGLEVILDQGPYSVTEDSVPGYSTMLTDDCSGTIAAGETKVCIITNNDQPTSCLPPPPGLISWWPGDGNANDIKDSNHGTLVNGATFTQGMVGQAFSFDGIDDYVDIGTPSNLNTLSSITLDAWVHRLGPGVGNFPEFNVIVGKAGLSGQSTSDGWYLRWIDGMPEFAIVASDNSINQAVGSVLPNGVWHHIAGTFDGSTRVMRLYVNGDLVVEKIITGGLPINSVPVRIGLSSNPFAPEPFNGMIDEVEIYGRALSQSEIQTIFNAGGAGKCKPVQQCTPPPSNMISWWPGDNNANDIQDGNHGTLVNGATLGAGLVGQAFTNLNSPNDYVRIPHATNIDLLNSAHTLDNWIFVTAFNSEWAPVTAVKPSGFGGLWYNNLGHFLRAHVWVNPTEVRFLDAPFIFPKDQWIHVAQVYEQSTATLSIYVNGALIGSGAGTIATLDIYGVNNPVLIGRGWSETVFPSFAQYSSSFDEVEIYNRALSQSEIQIIFNAGSAGKCKM